MPDALISRRDLQFMLLDWLKIEDLQAKDAQSRDSVRAILGLSEELAEDLFLLHYKLSDSVEPSLHNGEVTWFRKSVMR